MEQLKAAVITSHLRMVVLMKGTETIKVFEECFSSRLLSLKSVGEKLSKTICYEALHDEADKCLLHHDMAK